MTWWANMTISNNKDGYFHVECRTFGDSAAEAQAAGEFILKAIADGKKAFIRTRPFGDTNEEFDTGKVSHHGAVRFSFQDEPGEWLDMEKPDLSKSHGFGLYRQESTA